MNCTLAGGSLLFFSSQVYVNVYLKSVVRLDPQLAGALVMLNTLLLFPLTICFGWFSGSRRPQAGSAGRTGYQPGTIVQVLKSEG